jgi:transcriptional regulator with XRE-family HTH domain
VSDADDLAAFLRAKREQLRPTDVGLPDNGRRRTPGLRREEVATIAGVSIDYLVRLEQGRDTNPSPAVLAALAQALRLTEDERHHMMKLIARGQAPGMCPTATVAERAVPDTVRALLDALGATPAYVVGPFGDLLAWNTAWELVVTPLGLLEGPSPNVARHVFRHPSAATTFPDWDSVADDQVRTLRAASVRWAADDGLVALLAELQEVPAFAERWSRHGVEEKRRGVKRIAHPTAGVLRVAYEVLLLPDDAGQRLVSWLPADDATARALGELVAAPSPSSPARLRLVGES